MKRGSSIVVRIMLTAMFGLWLGGGIVGLAEGTEGAGFAVLLGIAGIVVTWAARD